MRKLVYSICLMFFMPALAQAGDRKEIEFFETHVRPVLADHCYKCHSTTAHKVKGKLRVDSLEALLKGGESGPAVVPGKPEKSLLIKAVNHDPAADLEMPPKEKLTDSAIADLTAWIKSGATWPVEKSTPAVAREVDSRPEFEAAGKKHWAFKPLGHPAIPTFKNTPWVKTPIDAFVLAKLKEKNIAPAAAADKRTLLRRVYLDLIGLPPTLSEQRAFMDDASPNALEKVVDDLLARPQYGERWGRHWLDVARYAESQGYERDDPKPFAWTYRQYVIDSFNADKPYTQFVTEQLAGDEMEGSNAESQTATAFLRLGPFDTIAADGKLARYDQLDDVVGTTSAAFLAQTIRCARCHDHKFEPFAQEDYYKLIAVFEPLKARDAKETLVGNEAEMAAYRKSQETFDAEALPLQKRADALKIAIIEKAVNVQSKGAPAIDAKHKTDLQNLIAILKKSPDKRSKGETDMLPRARRKIDEAAKEFAAKEDKQQFEKLDKQLAAIDAKRPPGHRAYVFTEESPKAPPTHLFYRGDCNKPGPKISPGVPTALGGDSLSPPVPLAKSTGRRLWLAKWMTGPARALLARVMVNRIWQYHFGHGLVETPNDFGIHGDPPTHPQLLEYLARQFVDDGWTMKRLHKMIVLSSVYQESAGYQTNPADPEGQLLWHWRTHRLEAEVVRDSLLAVSGQINLQVGGPDVFPPLAQKVVGDSAGFEWKTSDARDSARRSVYVYVKRNVGLPELEVMGMPDASGSTGQRTITTTALQSLMLMNSKFANEQAIHLAKLIEKDAGANPTNQIRQAFERTLCRPPTADELASSLEFMNTPTTPAHDAKTNTPLASLCTVLLNTNEFIYTN
jgi:hypothetical protein